MPHLPAQRRNVIDMVQDQLVLVQGVVGYLGGSFRAAQHLCGIDLQTAVPDVALIGESGILQHPVGQRTVLLVETEGGVPPAQDVVIGISPQRAQHIEGQSECCIHAGGRADKGVIISVLEAVRDMVDIVIRTSIGLGKIPLSGALGHHFRDWIPVQRIGKPGQPPDEDQGGRQSQDLSQIPFHANPPCIIE